MNNGKGNSAKGTQYLTAKGALRKGVSEKIAGAFKAVRDAEAAIGSAIGTVRALFGTMPKEYDDAKARAKELRAAARKVAVSIVGKARPEGMTDGALFQTKSDANGRRMLEAAGFQASADAVADFNAFTKYVNDVLKSHPGAPSKQKGASGGGSEDSDAPDVSDTTVHNVVEVLGAALASEDTGADERLALVQSVGPLLRKCLANAADDEERATLRAAFLQAVTESGIASAEAVTEAAE